MKGTILLVEDERHIADGLIFNLEAEGYTVRHAESGEKGLELLEKGADLIVLDLSLPGIDGIEVCRRARDLNPQLPILMLTARGSEKDRIEGLSAGADDYLTKPFSLAEFLLRIGGMLRRFGWYRPATNEAKNCYFGANHVNLADGSATTPQGEITLTDLESRLLALFCAREGEVLSRSELLESAWGLAPDTETRTLDNFIVRLRKYFEPDPANPVHFLTVRGRGYRFVQQSEETP